MKGRLAAMLGAMLIAFASCFFAPERPAGQGGGGDAAFDSTRPVDMLSGGDAPKGSGECPSDDMGSGTDACGSWGAQDVAGTGSIYRTSGVLQAKISTFGDQAECVSPTNIDFSHGVSIDLQQPLQGGSGDTTRFVANFDQGAFVKIEAKVGTSGLQIVASCSGPGGFSNATTYSASYRYLKLGLVTAGTSTVGAFYSDNGQSWNTMGTCSLTGKNLDLASVRFGATAGSGNFTERAAVFDDFQTCTTP